MPHKDPEARRAYRAAWQAANRERKRALDKLSYERNKVAIQARRAAKAQTVPDDVRKERDRRYRATYYALHAAELKERRRLAYVPKPRRPCLWKVRRFESRSRPQPAMPKEERTRRALAASKAWRLKNPGWYRAWALRNKAKLRVASRASYERTKEQRKVRIRERYRLNPQPFRNYAMAYYTRRRGLEQGPIDHDAIVLRDRGLCQICWKPVAPRDRSFDHIIPVSHGGPHMQHNLQLAHFRCNSRRGAGRIPGQVRLPI